MLNRRVRTIMGTVLVVSLLLGCSPAAAPTPAGKAGAPSPPPATTLAAPVATTTGAQPTAKPASPAPSPKPAAGEAKYGGTLTISTVADPASLDAQQEQSVNTWMPIAPAYNMLVEHQPQRADKLYPGLAESWEVSKDGMTYTFNIRNGVKFHDGSLLTADDVAYSLNRLCKPPRGIQSGVAGLTDPVKSIDVSGNQVKVTLDYAYGALLHVLAFAPSVIYPKRVVEAKGDMKTTVIGTGPYKFKSYTPGTSIELLKNPDYWVPGRPYLDRLVFTILKDSATRVAALRTGRIKMTGRFFAALTPSEVDSVKKQAVNLVFYPSTAQSCAGLFLNIRNKPFNDKRVRQAVNLAIDRQAATKVIAEGQGLLGRPYSIEGWNIPDEEKAKLPGYRQPKDADIAEAKRLMAEAGYPQGFELSILSRTLRLTQDSSVFVTDQLSKIGITCKITVQEDAVFWDSGRKAVHQAMIYPPAIHIADMEQGGRWLVKGGGLNFSGNDDDQKLNGLWDKQRRSLDENERKQISQEIERYVIDEAQPVIPIVVPLQYLAHWPEVKNFVPGVSELGNNNLEEIWLAQ